MESYARIDGIQYDIIATKKEWSVTIYNQFYVTFSIALGGDVEGLTDEYNRDKAITLRYATKGVYGDDGPTGSHSIEANKNPKTHDHLWVDGLVYGPKFYGDISFSKQGCTLQGMLREQFAKKKDFSFEAFVALDATKLDWSHYQFTTLAEIKAAPPEIVSRIYLEEAPFEALPDYILACKNLESLSINNRSYDSRLPFRDLTPDFWTLRKLSELHINGCELEALPPVPGKWEILTKLHLVNCPIKELPLEVWTAPNLESLFLERCELVTVPEEVSLPKLSFFAVTGNQLTTLPSAIGDLPALKRLKIERNPWESLPPNLEKIESLDLEVHYKTAFFDYTYKGADGKGTTAWDEEKYRILTDPALLKKVNPLLAKLEIPDLAPAFRALIKKGVAYRHGEKEDYRQLGNTRFGGLPDLPATIPYPKWLTKAREDAPARELAYEFIAQLNLDDLAQYQNYLPRTGTLYFFLNSFHGLYGALSETHPLALILHSDVAKDELIHGNTIDLKPDDFDEMPAGPYTGFKAEAFKTASLPDFYAIRQNEYLLKGEAATLGSVEDEDLEAYGMQLADSFREHFPVSHGSNVYVFTQHECPEHQAALAKRGAPEDWTVLLKVASEGDFNWSDAGDLFYVIHKSDLEKGDFSNIYVSLETS